jgi:hypothetical protein
LASQPKTTIAGQLNAARLAISNTLGDAELQGLVATYGYTAERLQAGQQLYDAALRAVNAKTAAAGAQQHATQQAREAEARARASYQALAQVARAVYARNTAQRTILGLNGAAPQSTAAFIAGATTLFDNILESAEIKDTLATYGYDEPRLQSERAAIATFDQAYAAQVAAMGAAQQATRAQEAALTALTKWLAQYLKIAKVALRETPEYMEKLGATARSSRTAAQRGAAKKAAATRALKNAA